MDTFFYLIGRDTDPILWWQMCIRGVIIFFYALILYRLVPRRAFGDNAAIDIVIVVVMGSTLSRALTGNSPLLASMAATACLALLYSAMAMLAWRIDPFSRLVKGRPVRLVKDGEIDLQALRRAQLGERDLMANLRAQGIADLDRVAEAYLERNGEISVIERT